MREETAGGETAGGGVGVPAASEEAGVGAPAGAAKPPDNCLFCQIVAGTVPAELVLDEPHAVAFLDVRPLFPGHCLLVPRAHYETLADLPDELVGPIFGAVRRLSVAVEAAMDAHGSFVALNNRVSQSVAHLHVHVVPRRRKDGLRGFFWPRGRYEGPAQAAETAAIIREALARVTAGA